MRSLLLLEMNEIPWRVIEHYKGDARFPALRQFFSDSQTYTTNAVDSGELSPWVTWPSLHRGMANHQHQISNLGQNPDTFKGTPIWEEFRKRGLSIGVCGSLQSWPPKDPGAGGFYIPDTFSHDASCIPKLVEPFQEFNLAQVKRNGRVVRGSFGTREVLKLLASTPRLGIRLSTLAAVVKQLFSERIDKHRIARRPIFQTILLWDVFNNLYNPANPPAFASFFTNHVAGVMHRYWHHIFPEDFGGRYKDVHPHHRETMDFAMAYVDRMLSDVLKFQKINPNIIIAFASSMGQSAVHRDSHEGFEASIPNVGKLFDALNIPTDTYRPLLAMVPQIAVDISEGSWRSKAKSALAACTTASGASLFKVQEIESSLSVTIFTPRLSDINAGYLIDPIGSFRTWEDAGIAMIPVEPGTAYHIPEGVLAIRKPEVHGVDSRTSIPADQVKSLLMEISGI